MNSTKFDGTITQLCVSNTDIFGTLFTGFFFNYVVFEQVETLFMFFSGLAIVVEYGCGE